MQPWYIIDANIFLDAIRYEVVGDQVKRDPAYLVIESYLANEFVWVYSDDIIKEYEYTFHKLRRTVHQSDDKRHFDTKAYNAVIAAIRQGPGLVEPSEEKLDEACNVIMDPKRAEHLRDEDDCIYLAAADEAREREAEVQVLLGSGDSDLYTLKHYKGVEIIHKDDFLNCISGPAYE